MTAAARVSIDRRDIPAANFEGRFIAGRGIVA